MANVQPMAVVSHYLTLTQANLDHGHIYLTQCKDIFPPDAFGGPNKSELAPRTVEVLWGSARVDTDIVRKRNFFRQRGWVRQFFAENQMVAGDRVLLEQLGPYSYRVSKAAPEEPSLSLMCLSIQQPWADLILHGKKLVENRSRTWPKAAQQVQAGGKVMLGIHASSSLTVWEGLAVEKRQHYAPGWSPGDSPDGAVLGVVNILQICRPKDLPAELEDHKYANHEPNNWCWVFGNPRKLLAPVEASGNSWLFHVDVPCNLLPADLR